MKAAKVLNLSSGKWGTNRHEAGGYIIITSCEEASWDDKIDLFHLDKAQWEVLSGYLNNAKKSNIPNSIKNALFRFRNGIHV